MRVKQRESFRISEEDAKTLELASKMSDIPKSEIIRAGAIREAKKILNKIERDK